MPLISVVIPCYNQGVFLAEAIQSVLGQTYTDLEIVVVDDGSTDAGTLAIMEQIEHPRIRLLRTANGGLASARNRGIDASSGAIILPLDADDLIAATYLEKAVAVFTADPGAGVVYPMADKFGAIIGPWPLPEYSPRLLLRQNMVYCSAMYHREIWENVGGYNTNMKYGWEDWDFWLSCSERGIRFVRIPEVLFYYRVRENSMTVSMGYGKKVRMMTQLFLNHPRLYAQSGLASLFGHPG